MHGFGDFPLSSNGCEHGHEEVPATFFVPLLVDREAATDLRRIPHQLGHGAPVFAGQREQVIHLQMHCKGIQYAAIVKVWKQLQDIEMRGWEWSLAPCASAGRLSTRSR